jgi:hypothetical protein
MAPNTPGGADIMSIKVREMLNDDALAFLQVHHAAVRGIAAKDYPPEVVEDWAPMPITNQSIERFLTNPMASSALSRRSIEGSWVSEPWSSRSPNSARAMSHRK